MIITSMILLLLIKCWIIIGKITSFYSFKFYQFRPIKCYISKTSREHLVSKFGEDCLFNNDFCLLSWLRSWWRVSKSSVNISCDRSSQNFATGWDEDAGWDIVLAGPSSCFAALVSVETPQRERWDHVTEFHTCSGNDFLTLMCDCRAWN